MTDEPIIVTKQEIKGNLQAVDVVCQKTEDTTRELSSNSQLDAETRQRLDEIQRDVRILQLAASDIHRRVAEIVERAPPGSFDPPGEKLQSTTTVAGVTTDRSDDKQTPATTLTGTAQQTPETSSDAQLNQATNLAMIDPDEEPWGRWLPRDLPKEYVLQDFIDFEDWHFMVKNRLDDLGLADLINAEIPRPPQDDIQTYEKWRKMSLRVNIWLCNQVSQPILKLRPMRSTELTFADEHMAFFREQASSYKVSAVNRTWHAVMNMKRSQFDSLEKYVEEWRRTILKAEQQDLFLGAILELLRNVKDDIPDWTHSIIMRLYMDQPEGLSQEEFHRYCDKVIHAGQSSVLTTMPKKKSRGRNRRGKNTRSHVG
ncbi:hypothetical protein Plec18170_007422 [Paecilomyces lecythidis]